MHDRGVQSELNMRNDPSVSLVGSYQVIKPLIANKQASSKM